MPSRPIPIPALTSLLFWIESCVDEPLDCAIVESLAWHAASITLPDHVAKALDRARGFSDIDPPAAWEQFEFLRDRTRRQGVHMSTAFPPPRQQLAADIEALRRVANEHAMATPEVIDHQLADLLDMAHHRLDTFEHALDAGEPLMATLLQFVNTDTDDFSCFDKSRHMLAWMGDRPFAIIRDRIETGLRRQDPGSVLESIRCIDDPHFLTAFRDEGDSSPVTRMGVGVQMVLQATAGNQQQYEFGAVFSLIGAKLDSEPVWTFHLDIPGQWDEIEESLIVRLYQIET